MINFVDGMAVDQCIDQYKARIAELESKLDALMASHRGVESLVIAREKERDELESRLGNRDAQIFSMGEELIAANMRAESAESRLSSCLEANATLSKERAHWMTVAGDNAIEIEKYVSRLARYRKYLEDISAPVVGTYDEAMAEDIRKFLADDVERRETIPEDRHLWPRAKPVSE